MKKVTFNGKALDDSEIKLLELEALKQNTKAIDRIKNNIVFFFWFFIGWWLIGIPALLILTSVFSKII